MAKHWFIHLTLVGNQRQQDYCSFNYIGPAGGIWGRNFINFRCSLDCDKILDLITFSTIKKNWSPADLWAALVWVLLKKRSPTIIVVFFSWPHRVHLFWGDYPLIHRHWGKEYYNWYNGRSGCRGRWNGLRRRSCTWWTSRCTSPPLSWYGQVRRRCLRFPSKRNVFKGNKLSI